MNQIIVDANIVLRYLLKDNSELFSKAIEIIEEKTVLIRTEVLVEIIYVLNKTYKVPKSEIVDAINGLLDFDNIEFESKNLIKEALNVYHNKNIDIVDSVLCALSKLLKFKIATFDKKLKACCEESV